MSDEPEQYDSMEIIAEVSPSYESRTFQYGAEQDKEIYDVISSINREIMIAVCSIVKNKLTEFNKFPEDIHFKYTIVGDDYQLDLYPRKNIQDASQCDQLTFTADFVDKGTIGQLMTKNEIKGGH
jgi:hypothetical protein